MPFPAINTYIYISIRKDIYLYNIPFNSSAKCNTGEVSIRKKMNYLILNIIKHHEMILGEVLIQDKRTVL